MVEIDVPQLQLLSANLKPEECVKLVFLDSNPELSDVQIRRLTREQSCFRRLVRWICHLRTVTRNTYTIVNDFLDRIGRSDLIACLAEFNMKSSKPRKVIRNVQPDYSDYYEDTETVTPKQKESVETKPTNQYSNQTIDKISGQTAIRISLRTAGIILLSTILLTCCCTLFIRNRLANLFNKVRRKKKKSKLIPIEAENLADVSRSYYVRKPRLKRKRAPSYEMVHTATQNEVVAVPKEPEEPAPTGCYKCYKKKRKKSGKRARR